MNFPRFLVETRIIANANTFTNKAHHIITEDAMHILIANINLIFKSASDLRKKLNLWAQSCAPTLTTAN
jgi:hypothetical protein